MAARKSIYLSKQNDSALIKRFSNDPAMCDDGQLNYSRAVNAALDEWQQQLSTSPAHCSICDNTGWNSAAADANFHIYCSCKIGKQMHLDQLQQELGKIGVLMVTKAKELGGLL